jgi:hypothetical protein
VRKARRKDPGFRGAAADGDERAHEKPVRRDEAAEGVEPETGDEARRHHAVVRKLGAAARVLQKDESQRGRRREDEDHRKLRGDHQKHERRKHPNVQRKGAPPKRAVKSEPNLLRSAGKVQNLRGKSPDLRIKKQKIRRKIDD